MRLLRQFSLLVRDFVEYVPVEELEDLDGNVVDQRTLVVLAEDIFFRGVLEPITLGVVPATGRTFVKNGNHRLVAARMLELPAVPVVVVPVTSSELEERMNIPAGYFMDGRRIPVIWGPFQQMVRPSFVGFSGTRPPEC